MPIVGVDHDEERLEAERERERGAIEKTTNPSQIDFQIVGMEKKDR